VWIAGLATYTEEGATLMGLTVNTNVQSINAQRLLGVNSKSLGKSLERLSSGFRINKASDDAAGLQISESLRSQIRGSEAALSNVQDGINVLNTVDGALGTVTTDLQRVRELAVQSANDTLSGSQRSAISQEVKQLVTNITQTSKSTAFNGKTLLDGSLTSFNIQAGANAGTTANTINVASVGGVNPFGSVNGSALGLGSAGAGIGVSTGASARATISKVDAALNTINTRRAAVGAVTNRLESTANSLSIAVENFSASESRIRNVDVAKESANLTRNQILQQASATILAQANQSPQLALSLIR
jgi:flagellin